MKLRVLTANDAGVYRDLRLFGLQEAVFAFSDSYEDEKNITTSGYEIQIGAVDSPPEQFILGAFTVGDKLAGFVRFKRDPRSKAKHRSSLFSLYVAPQHRNAGIAKKLLHEALRMAATIDGLEQVQLWVIIAGANSLVTFYEKLDFEILGSVIEEDLIIEGRYVNAVCMVRYLGTKGKENDAITRL